MKIFRYPKSNKSLEQYTDTVFASDSIISNDGSSFFDGDITMNKDGEKQSRVRISVDPEDLEIIVPKAISKLRKENEKLKHYNSTHLKLWNNILTSADNLKYTGNSSDFIELCKSTAHQIAYEGISSFEEDIPVYKSIRFGDLLNAKVKLSSNDSLKYLDKLYTDHPSDFQTYLYNKYGHYFDYDEFETLLKGDELQAIVEEYENKEPHIHPKELLELLTKHMGHTTK